MMSASHHASANRNLFSNKAIVFFCFMLFVISLLFVQTYLPPKILRYISSDSISTMIETGIHQNDTNTQDSLVNHDAIVDQDNLDAGDEIVSQEDTISTTDDSGTQENTCKYGKYAEWPFIEQHNHLNERRKKLLYIKTPKSASSTISHILQRYTTRENMTVAYPDFENDRWVLLDESDGISAKLRAVGTSRDDVDALVSHVVYNSTWVNTMLGTDQPFRITSVRDPLARSWSMFLHGLEFNISEFTFGATNAWEFARLLEMNSQASYMSGFGSGIDMNNATQVAEHYDHIIPSNKVLESMITLAPKIGLQASDLLYFSQKTSFHKTPLDVVKPEEKAEIEKIMAGKTRVDADILEIARKNLEKEMQELPEEIKSILQDVPEMLEEVKKSCGDIHPEDESCLRPDQIRWDGNAMCLFKCINEWSSKNIYCK